jgi:hypothetical protein
MLIWVFAFLLFGIFGVLGFYKGAVRMLVSLVGFGLGLLLAFPVGRLLDPLWPKIGLVNVVWNLFWGPLLIFFLCVGIFVGLSFYLHRLTDLHYKYRSDDFQYLQWQRLNERLGIAVGVLVGGAHFLVLCLLIHVLGYVTYQATPEEGGSALTSGLNNARAGLASSGLDRLTARMDSMPTRYYQAADIAGLLYHNAAVHRRLVNYPPYLNLDDRVEFQELAADTEYLQMLQNRSDLISLINHPRTQAIAGNQEIVDALLGVDLADLRVYLETGESPQFAEQKILGRWRLEQGATFMRERKRRPDMPAAEVKMLREIIGVIGPATTFRASPDSRAMLKVDLSDPIRQQIERLLQGQSAVPTNQPPPELDPQAVAAPQMDPAIAARYGLGRGGRGPGGRPQIPGVAVPAPAARPAAPPKPAMESPFPLAGIQGKWEQSAGKYSLELQDEKGRPLILQATATEDTLILNLGGASLVFSRIG